MNIPKNDLIWAPPGEEVYRQYPNGIQAIRHPFGFYIIERGEHCLVHDNWALLVREITEYEGPVITANKLN